MLSVLIAVALGNAAEALVQPASREPFRIVADSTTENVEIQNDSSLYLSVEVRNVRSGSVLIAHVTDPVLVETAPNFVGPQGGIFTAGRSNDVKLPQPQGRNATVTVISGGTANPLNLRLTGAEEALALKLQERAFIDQCVIPLIVAALGAQNPGSVKGKILRSGIAGMLAQNRQAYEDIRGGIAQGDVGSVLAPTLKVVIRDVEAGGPLTQAGVLVFGSGFAERIAARIARSQLQTLLTSWHPGLKAADILLKLWNWGPSVFTCAQFVYDAHESPRKFQYHVYFKPGAGDFSPKAVRTDGENIEFTIHGNKLDSATAKPVFVLKDTDGNTVSRSEVTTIATDGKSMKTSVNGSVLKGRSGYLNASVLIDGETTSFTDHVVLTATLRITALTPPAGRPGQQIKISAETVYPFTFANTVYFGRQDKTDRVKGKTVVAGRRHLVVEVPDLPENPETWYVWIEEARTGRRADSNLLPFKRLKRTYDDFQQERMEGLMQERDIVYEGVLTDENPENIERIVVPGGMQVEMTLNTVYGPEGDLGNHELSGWGLRMLGPNDAGTLVRKSIAYSTNSPTSNVVERYVQHTSNGSKPFNVYYAEIARKTDVDVRYKFTVSLNRKPDAGTEDAGEDAQHAKRIDANGSFDAHLYGEAGVYMEDRNDWYRVPNVPKDAELTVTVAHKAKQGSRDPVIKRVTLYRVLPNGSLEKAGESPANMGLASGNVTLKDEEAAERDYLLHVEHGGGLFTYSVTNTIGYDHGPALDMSPIVSDFNNGTNEGWKVEGNYQRAPSDAVHQGNAGFDGYVLSRDYEEAQTGPLDVVFVIDTTGSMGSVMDTVKKSSQDIVRILSARSPSLRVGLVGYKDQAADAGSATSVQALSANVQQMLSSLGGFGASGGGGDGPEDVLLGLDAALDMTWRNDDGQGRDVAKVVVLIGDAPAKLTGGRDGGGRTIASVSLKARQKGVNIYAVGVSGDSTMREHFTNIARSARGQPFFVTDAAKVAEPILELAGSAVDRHSPRYYIAPRKFLGDVSRFYGLCLSYEARTQITNGRIDGPDIVLEGASKTLEFFSLMHTAGETVSFASPDQVFVVKLDKDSYFTVKQTGRRATEEDIREVLSDLRALKIRAEYEVGRDDERMDDVKLGVVASPTDRGLSEQYVQLLRSLEGYIANIQRLGDLMKGRYDNPVGLVASAYSNAGGVRDIALRSYTDAGDLSRLVDHISSTSTIATVFAREIATLRGNLAAFRRKGEISDAEWAAFIAQSSSWTSRYDEAKKIADDYLATLIVRAQSDTTAFDPGASITESQEAFRKKNEADAKLRTLRSEMAALRAKPPVFTAIR